MTKSTPHTDTSSSDNSELKHDQATPVVDSKRNTIVETPPVPASVRATPPPKKPSRSVPLTTTIFLVVIIGVVSFIGGARSPELLSSLNPANSTQNKSLPGELDYTQLNEVYSLLKNRFDGTLDTQKLLDGAKKGMTDAAGDPYTVYFTDKEANEFFGELDGKFSGIGAELGKKDDKLSVMSVIDNSPAAKAGILPGDIVAQVNGDATTGWSVDKAVSVIRGDKGTSVKLTVLRGDEVKDYTITRDDIVDPSVKSEITADNIGILRLSRFNDTDTLPLAQKAAQDFKAKGVKSIILDLRGNGGGYVEAARGIAGLWLDNKTVVEERQGTKVLDKLTSEGGKAVFAGIPTVVLIDGGSASASEIVAGALHDYGAAQLVGDKSFGKGSVQQIERVPGGGQLKITIAKWYTPKGKNINKEGIQPDVKVPVDANTPVGTDPQKDKAIELLNK